MSWLLDSGLISKHENEVLIWYIKKITITVVEHVDTISIITELLTRYYIIAIISYSAVEYRKMDLEAGKWIPFPMFNTFEQISRAAATPAEHEDCGNYRQNYEEHDYQDECP